MGSGGRPLGRSKTFNDVDYDEDYNGDVSAHAYYGKSSSFVDEREVTTARKSKRRTVSDPTALRTSLLLPENATNDAEWFAKRGLMSKKSFKIYKKEAKKKSKRKNKTKKKSIEDVISRVSELSGSQGEEESDVPELRQLSRSINTVYSEGQSIADTTSVSVTPKEVKMQQRKSLEDYRIEDEDDNGDCGNDTQDERPSMVDTTGYRENMISTLGMGGHSTTTLTPEMVDITTRSGQRRENRISALTTDYAAMNGRSQFHMCDGKTIIGIEGGERTIEKHIIEIDDDDGDEEESIGSDDTCPSSEVDLQTVQDQWNASYNKDVALHEQRNETLKKHISFKGVLAAADNDDDDKSISLNENDMLNMKKDSPSLSCPVIQVSQGDNYRDQMSALDMGFSSRSLRDHWERNDSMCADELGSLSSGGGGTDDAKEKTKPAALPLTELSRNNSDISHKSILRNPLRKDMGENSKSNMPRNMSTDSSSPILKRTSLLKRGKYQGQSQSSQSSQVSFGISPTHDSAADLSALTSSTPFSTINIVKRANISDDVPSPQADEAADIQMPPDNKNEAFATLLKSLLSQQNQKKGIAGLKPDEVQTLKIIARKLSSVEETADASDNNGSFFRAQTPTDDTSNKDPDVTQIDNVRQEPPKAVNSEVGFDLQARRISDSDMTYPMSNVSTQSRRASNSDITRSTVTDDTGDYSAKMLLKSSILTDAAIAKTLKNSVLTVAAVHEQDSPPRTTKPLLLPPTIEQQAQDISKSTLKNLEDKHTDVLTEGMSCLSTVMLINVYRKLRELSILGHTSSKLIEIDCNSHQMLMRQKEQKRLGILKPQDEHKPYINNTRAARFVVQHVLDEYEMLETTSSSNSFVNKVNMDYDASLLQDFRTWVHESKGQRKGSFSKGSVLMNLVNSGLEVVWFSDRHPDDTIYCICVDRESATVTVVFYDEESTLSRLRNSSMMDHPNPLLDEDYEGNSDLIQIRAAVSEDILRPRRDSGKSTIDEICEKVDKIGEELKAAGSHRYNLTITGHSKAGGLATVCGFYIAANPSVLELTSAVKIYTFASSHVGGKTFHDSFKHLEETGRLLHARFTNSNELDSLPLYHGDEWYKHVGMNIRLHSDCKQALDIAYDQELGLFNEVSHILLNIMRGRGDHLISKYQSRMYVSRDYWESQHRGNRQSVVANSPRSNKRTSLPSLEELHAIKCRFRGSKSRVIQSWGGSSMLIYLLVSILVSLEIALVLRMADKVF